MGLGGETEDKKMDWPAGRLRAQVCVFVEVHGPIDPLMLPGLVSFLGGSLCAAPKLAGVC